MLFTDAQIEHYKTQGYLSGPCVLSEEQISALKERIDDILHGRIPFPKHLMGETVEQSRAKGQLPSVKVVNIFRRDPTFAALIGNSTISALAHQLMSGPVRIWEDQMIYKPAYDAKTALAWHQDYTFWNHVGPADMGTCWIALDDATVDNGCMHVIPTSHLWPMRYNREDAVVEDPHWLLQQEGIPDEADLTSVPCEVKAGHCHFHHCRTFHGSYGNKTDNPRRSYIMHLMPGYTRRLGDNWNERMGNVETVGVGKIVQGPDYPELAEVPTPLSQT